MSETVQMTRYERVQEILDCAAGSSAADYGGRGRFWHLPLPQLLQMVIHGVRIIAPAGEVKAAGCCHGESQPRRASGSPPSRSRRRLGAGARTARAGAVRRDAVPAPALGRHRVAPDDIELISDWIDDGCRTIRNRSLSLRAAAQTTSTSVETIDVENVEADGADVGRLRRIAERIPYQYGELKQRDESRLHVRAADQRSCAMRSARCTG